MVSFTPRLARSQPAAPIQSAPITAATKNMPQMTVVGGEPARPTPATAAPSPPITNAPSPPITTSPARAGMAVQSAVSSRGDARCSVF